MSAAAEETSHELVVPGTGEILDLREAATNELGAAIDAVKLYQDHVKRIREAISHEVLERMDREGKWTYKGGGWKIEGTSNRPVSEYDTEALRADLTKLVRKHRISAGARDRAIEKVCELKIHKAGINALEAIGDDVKEVIAKHRREAPRQYRPVSVTPLETA